MRLVEGPVTIEYPEEKTPVYPRFRGRHKLHRFEDTGLEKCVGCSLCAAACPADCIRVVAAENTPDNQVSAGERYAAVYEINMTRCIFCGYCEVACPFDAITMGNDYELADYDALRPDLHQGDAAGRTRSSARRCGRRASSGRVVRAGHASSSRAIGALGGRARRGAAAQPVLQRALAGGAPARAGARCSCCCTREFLAAAQMIVYAGAVMVLYVFVVAYIGGVDEPLGPEGPGLRKLGAAVRRARCSWSCASAIIGSGLSRRSTRTAPTSTPASARPAADRRAAPQRAS